jgi:hypothetical protein
MILFIVVVVAADFFVVVITECGVIVNASIYIWRMRCL